MAMIVGVRFKRVGKIYYFSPQNIELKVGDGVIVETARGIEFGKVAISAREVDDKEVMQPLKNVIRKASQKDVEQVLVSNEKRSYAFKVCQEKIKQHKLEMKLVDAEYTFDKMKVIFYFTSDKRVDFRELVRDLATVFKVRIELRQIGIRDEAKIFGGIAPCGRPCCCANHLGDFEKVSIKMAKVQGLSLNPGKISGLCGRLMCCLAYENEHYKETTAKMPKVGSQVGTPDGKAIVTSNDALKEVVHVKMEKADGGFDFKQFPLKEVKFKKRNNSDDHDKHDDVPGDVKKLLD